MFERIILWCEFPHKVDWKKLDKLLKEINYKPEIYVACTSYSNYNWWVREIKKACKNISEVNAWPVLTKAEGYWFSGFTSRYCIDRLLEFKKTKLKIDLEPPLPKYKYSNLGVLKYILGIAFKKGKNSKYLLKTIKEISQNNDVLINEFPLPKFMLKNWGCYYPTHNKNIMCYTSLLHFRSLLRWWNFRIALKRKAKMCSVGLIQSGIFGNEPYYNNTRELATDLKYAERKGFKNIAIYSIDAIMKRKNPNAWLSILKDSS